MIRERLPQFRARLATLASRYSTLVLAGLALGWVVMIGWSLSRVYDPLEFWLASLRLGWHVALDTALAALLAAVTGVLLRLLGYRLRLRYLPLLLAGLFCGLSIFPSIYTAEYLTYRHHKVHDAVVQYRLEHPGLSRRETHRRAVAWIAREISPAYFLNDKFNAVDDEEQNWFRRYGFAVSLLFWQIVVSVVTIFRWILRPKILRAALPIG